jgi:hypothetical protein
MRFDKGVWAAIVSQLKHLSPTLRVWRRAGERTLRISGADAHWHVVVDMELNGEWTRKDAVSLVDEEMLMCTDAAARLTLGVPRDAVRVNILVRNGVLFMKTRRSSAVMSLPKRRETIAPGPDGAISLLGRPPEDIIRGGADAVHDSAWERLSGASSANLLADRVVRLRSFEVNPANIVTALVTADVHTGSVKLEGTSEWLRVVCMGAVVDIPVISSEASEAVPPGMRCSGTYVVEWVRAMLSMRCPGSTTRVVFYDAPDSDVCEETGGYLLGAEYSSPVMKARIVMPSGETRGRPTIVAQRRAVKRLLRDGLSAARASADIEREAKRARDAAGVDVADRAFKRRRTEEAKRADPLPAPRFAAAVVPAVAAKKGRRRQRPRDGGKSIK